MNGKSLPKRVETVLSLEVHDKSNTMMILRGNDKIATKNLIINSNDDQLKKNLSYINMEGPGDPTVRRKINKGFLDCLEEVQLDRPSALVWLKKRICFDVCQTMMGDWSYSGKI